MAYAKNGIKLGLVNLSDYDLVVKDSKGKEIPEDARVLYPGKFYATWVAWSCKRSCSRSYSEAYRTLHRRRYGRYQGCCSWNIRSS